MTTKCYTTSHLHQVFFRFRLNFLAFFAGISHFKSLEFKEFNKTIIPVALVGYETGYSQVGVTRLVGYLLSHIRAIDSFVFMMTSSKWRRGTILENLYPQQNFVPAFCLRLSGPLSPSSPERGREKEDRPSFHSKQSEMASV